MNRISKSLLGTLLIVAASFAAAKTPEKTTVADSGTFGVYVNGQRVAAETFSIQQRPDMSVATSEFKTTDGKSQQRSELQIAPSGELRHYEWRELSPEKSQAVIEPSEQFLIEKITVEPGAKPQEKPFLLGPTTMILDDYFFSHREILVWRYLAQTCGPTGVAGCRPQKANFGVVIPHQQISSAVTVQYVGPERVNIRGTDYELARFDISSEDAPWTVWLDISNMKAMRMMSGNSEILRD
jgi:hypothetical protein